MLNASRPADMRERFEAQTPTLLADGLHYEQRIAERRVIATREGNWHDLFNAMIWAALHAYQARVECQTGVGNCAYGHESPFACAICANAFR